MSVLKRNRNALRFIVAALLATSAILEIELLWRLPYAVMAGWPIPRWLTCAQVSLELFLSGALLVNGEYRKSLDIICCVLFTAFSAVTAFLWLTGEKSCGCFGRVSIHPAITFFVDVGIAASLAAIILFKEANYTHSGDDVSKKLGIRFAVIGCTCAMVFVLLFLHQPSGLTSDSTGFLRVGQNLRLSLGSIIDKERFYILCYRTNCPHCSLDMGNWIDWIGADAARNRSNWIIWNVGNEEETEDLMDGIPHDGLTIIRRPMPLLATPQILSIQNGSIEEVFASLEAFFSKRR